MSVESSRQTGEEARTEFWAVLDRYYTPKVSLGHSKGAVLTAQHELEEAVRADARGALSLFQPGDFVLASGARSGWKIECDAIDEEGWRGLALIAAETLGLRFSRAVGVPTGGEPFARAMQEYATDGPVLVCDDVLTTGGSLAAVRAEYPGSLALVAFARGSVPSDVQALWSLAVRADARRDLETALRELAEYVATYCNDPHVIARARAAVGESSVEGSGR